MRRPDAWCRTVVVVVSVCLSGAASTRHEPPALPGPQIVGEGRDDTVVISGREAAEQERAWRAAGADPAMSLVEYMRSDQCPRVVRNRGPLACAAGFEARLVPDCGGDEPVPPLWRRERATAADAWEPGDRIALWSCPQDVAPALSQEDFRRLPIAPSVLAIQPARDVVLVNMPTIVYTDPAVQTFTTTLLGFAMEVQAVPVSFTWDFGDGSAPVTTASPGHPYPHQDVAHAYPRAGVHTITLSTQYTGRYRVSGGDTWLDVVGNATTVTTSDPIEAVEAHSHLVADDCTDDRDGPWC